MRDLENIAEQTRTLPKEVEARCASVGPTEIRSSKNDDSESDSGADQGDLPSDPANVD